MINNQWVQAGAGFEIGSVVKFLGCGSLPVTNNLIVKEIRQVFYTDGGHYFRLYTVYTNGYFAVEAASDHFELSTYKPV